jgi:hypothetical protein
MERGRWEGQNLQLKEFQRLEEKEEEEEEEEDITFRYKVFCLPFAIQKHKN